MAAIWEDVQTSRREADEHAEAVLKVVQNPDADETDGLLAAYHVFEALRFEIRAASQTISHALTVHAEDLRDIARRAY